MIFFQIGIVLGEQNYVRSITGMTMMWDRYDGLYKIFELIYDNVEKLKENHVSVLCALCIR